MWMIDISLYLLLPSNLDPQAAYYFNRIWIFGKLVSNLLVALSPGKMFLGWFFTTLKLVHGIYLHPTLFLVPLESKMGLSFSIFIDVNLMRQQKLLESTRPSWVA